MTALLTSPPPMSGSKGTRELAHLTDEALISLVASSDDGALAELYDRFGRVAYGLALRILRDEALAQDAVQEAFLAVWHSADRFLAERAKASTWILTLVHRRAVDLVRREDRRRGEPLERAPEPASPATESSVSGSAWRRSSRRTRSTARRWTSVRIHVLALARSARNVAALRQTWRNASCTASSAWRSSRRTRSARP